MKISQRVIRVIEVLILLFILWSVLGISLNTRTLSAIKVTLKKDGVEHRDKVVLNVGKADEPPDYRLRINQKGKWIDLGTFGNTWIKEGLTFTPARSIPLRQITEMQLLDEDKFETDLLEQVPFDISKSEYTGNNYSFRIEEKRELESGFAWFFGTPVGVAIATGITIAVVILVLSRLG